MFNVKVLFIKISVPPLFRICFDGSHYAGCIAGLLAMRYWAMYNFFDLPEHLQKPVDCLKVCVL
jgi:hypothetical protein